MWNELMPCAKPSERTAFTLIELITAILIMAIIAAVATPKFSTSIARYRAQAAGMRIASDLAYARNCAMSLGTEQPVVFDSAAIGYTMTAAPEPNTSQLGYTIGLADAGYVLSQITPDFDGSNQVTFDIYGQPHAGGSVVITSGTVTRTVVLDAVSGKAQVQ